jgi:plastocyanin
MQRAHWYRLRVLAALIALAVASAAGGAVRAGSAGVVANVAVLNFSFDPTPATIVVGDTVTWTNSSGLHNVVADDQSFTSGTATSSFVYSHQFAAPGSYPYYCSVHGGPGGSGMSGVIVVVALPEATYLPLIGGAGAS